MYFHVNLSLKNLPPDYFLGNFEIESQLEKGILKRNTSRHCSLFLTREAQAMAEVDAN